MTSLISGCLSLSDLIKVIYRKRRNVHAVLISWISRRALDQQKFDVSENYNHYNHYRIQRNKRHMHENLTMQICLLGLDARKCSCAKIS